MTKPTPKRIRDLVAESAMVSLVQIPELKAAGIDLAELARAIGASAAYHISAEIGGDE